MLIQINYTMTKLIIIGFFAPIIFTTSSTKFKKNQKNNLKVHKLNVLSKFLNNKFRTIINSSSGFIT